MSERLSYENGVEVGYERGLKAAHEDPNILASYSWTQGYVVGLDAARDALNPLLHEEPCDCDDCRLITTAQVLIDALRGEA